MEAMEECMGDYALCTEERLRRGYFRAISSNREAKLSAINDLPLSQS
jgi:hypothetical protein